MITVEGVEGFLVAIPVPRANALGEGGLAELGGPTFTPVMADSGWMDG